MAVEQRLVVQSSHGLCLLSDSQSSRCIFTHEIHEATVEQQNNTPGARNEREQKQKGNSGLETKIEKGRWHLQIVAQAENSSH
jgi:hypothetical protein